MSTIYDNFSGGTIDTAKWTKFTPSGLTQTGGHIAMVGNGPWGTGLISVESFPRISFSDVKIRIASQSHGAIVIAGLQSSPSILDFNQGHITAVYFSGGNIFSLLDAGFTDLGLPWVNSTDYELTFSYVGASGISVYINGGAYTNQLLFSATDPYSTYMSTNVANAGVEAWLTGASYDAVSMPLTNFGIAIVSDGASVDSTAHLASIVSTIQSMSDTTTATYFDSTDKISRVDAFYTHEAGRQDKRIVHRYPTFMGQANWAEFVQDGTWQKTMVVAHDFDGATAIIPRAFIDTASEDLTHSSGTMNLNT